MKKLIFLDMVCWFSSAGIALYLQYPTVAAFFASGGIIVLYKSVHFYRQIMKQKELSNDIR